MRATLGPRATAVHLVLLASLVLPAVAMLLLALSIPQDPEMLWLLTLIFTAPILLVGIVAALEALSVARGRRVSRLRAAVFALVGVVGAAVLAWTQGVFAFAATLVDRPGDVEHGWPVTTIWTRDRSGTDAFHLDAAGIWVAATWFTLGVASLVASARDSRSDRSTPVELRDPSDATG